MDQDGADIASGSRVGAQYGGAERAPLPRALHGVILDVDGTLLDTEPAYRTAFIEALAQFGRSISLSDYGRLTGLPSSARRLMLPELFGAAFPVPAFFETYYRCRATALAGGIPLKPGVLSILAMLDRAGMPCAVATSASAATAAAHLATAGLAGRFKAVVTRDDVANGKPAPDSFVCAAARLDALPANCLAVEDSYHGVSAASQAGCMVVMVPDSLPPTVETRGLCVATIDGLPGLEAYLAPMLMQLHPTMDRSRLRV